MSNIIKFKNRSFEPLIYQNQRVVTFRFIDWAHEHDNDLARHNFRENISHFVEGKDYFLITRGKAMGDIPPQLFKYANKIYFITERGYLKLCKTFRSDLSWKIQDALIDIYFRSKDLVGEKIQLQQTVLDLVRRIETLELFVFKRKDFKPEDKSLALRALTELGGLCLVCKQEIIVTPDGKKTKLLQWDHWDNNRSNNRRDNIMPLGQACNLKKKDSHWIAGQYLFEKITLHRKMAEIAGYFYQSNLFELEVDERRILLPKP